MMKNWAKLLLIGMIAATAYLSWQRNAHSTASALSPLKVISTPDPAAIALQPLRSQDPSNSLDKTMASLHSKLRRWRESQVDNPNDEEERDQLLQEMFALVTDESVAEIIQSLSPEEMDTPFGLGALHHWMKVAPVAASNWLASRRARRGSKLLRSRTTGSAIAANRSRRCYRMDPKSVQETSRLEPVNFIRSPVHAGIAPAAFERTAPA